MADKPRIEVRQYKSRRAYELDVIHMMATGWAVQSISTTTSRRVIGGLFGPFGAWLLPQLTVYHVTYISEPEPPAHRQRPPAPDTGSRRHLTELIPIEDLTTLRSKR